ncbi:STAS domain-containing protein [Streptomyces sp. NPDC048383]|uniref:STAS domain-containing protein n=1 Tax=Streptomyces sp. NPDC048383 TaxID=3155386 RepID=UPI003420C743
MDVQHRAHTLWVIVGGELDTIGGAALGRVLERDIGFERVLMLDLHGVILMNREGLLHLLDLHHRAECQGLRVLVVGWQAQPQQFMANQPGHNPRPPRGDRGTLRAPRIPTAHRATRPPGTRPRRIRPNDGGRTGRLNPAFDDRGHA